MLRERDSLSRRPSNSRLPHSLVLVSSLVACPAELQVACPHTGLNRSLKISIFLSVHTCIPLVLLLGGLVTSTSDREPNSHWFEKTIYLLSDINPEPTFYCIPLGFVGGLFLVTVMVSGNSGLTVHRPKPGNKGARPRSSCSNSHCEF